MIFAKAIGIDFWWW